MALDSILSEVRRIREEYAAQFHGDVHAMMEDLRRRHAESNRQSVTRPSKPRRKSSATSKTNGGAQSSLPETSEWASDQIASQTDSANHRSPGE